MIEFPVNLNPSFQEPSSKGVGFSHRSLIEALNSPPVVSFRVVTEVARATLAVSADDLVQARLGRGGARDGITF